MTPVSAYHLPIPILPPDTTNRNAGIATITTERIPTKA